MAKAKKIVKLNLTKTISPITRENTRATTQKDKEKSKQIEQGGQVQKKKRKRYVAQPN